jgi:hypothetical protein
VGDAEPRGDLGQAKFQLWITEQQREDLACCWERRMGKRAGDGCLSII